MKSVDTNLGGQVFHCINYFSCMQIADSGMSRDLEDDSCYIVSGGKIPVKWTAPEVLLL